MKTAHLLGAYILVLSLLCASLCACARQEATPPENSIADGSSSSPISEEKTVETDGFTIRQISSSEGAGPMISAEGGCYHLRSVFDGGLNIFYTDYETNREVFLCARPECTHHSASCTSFVDTSDGTLPGLAYTNGMLLLITPAAGNNGAVPKIERMDPSGSNREVLHAFEANQYLGSGYFCADDKELYFILQEYGEQWKVSCSVVAVDLSTGALRKIRDCGEEVTLVGGTEKSLYFSNTAHSALISYDLHDKQESVVSWYSETKDLENRQFFGENLYAYDRKADRFYRYSLLDGSFTVVENRTGQDLTISCTPRGVFGSYLVVSAAIGHDDENDLIFTVLILDFDGDTIINAPALLNEKGRPIDVLALYEDRIYADYSIEKTTHTTEYDGVLTEFAIQQQRTGSLSLEDFLNGKANFTPTEQLW